MKKKLVAGIMALCVISGTIHPQWLQTANANTTTLNGTYTSMEKVEKDFKGAYQDEDVNLSSSSKIVTDSNISDLSKYSQYTNGGYTSLADYMYSVDSDGAIVRDGDYGIAGNRRNGFLYYNTKMTNFTIELEYKHGLAGKGWRSTYIGFGAQEIGDNFYTNQHTSSIRLQPAEMYLENQAGTTNYTNWSDYAAAKEKYSTAAAEGKEVWYSFKLTVEDGVATWSIDGQQFSSALTNYIGGYFYIGTMALDTAFRNIKITCNDIGSKYNTMAGVEEDFKGAYQDEDANLSSSSKIVTDDNISDLSKYSRYTSGGYTSLADYMYSIDSDGAIVRDVDYGTAGNRRNGFLYYNTKMTNFTVELEYKHGLAGSGWRSTYIGFGAQEIGDNFYTNQHVSSVRLQPAEMYLENQAGTTNYTNWSDYAAAKEKYSTAAAEGKEVWYSFKLTVEDGVATWSIDGQQFSSTLKDYVGGYFYIGTMALNTAFRNITITCNDQSDYSMYDVYYATEYSNPAQQLYHLSKITKTDFENCWSLNEGTFTRIGTGEFAGATSGSSRASMLYFNDKSYNAFEMEFDYSFGTAVSDWKWLAVGFGADTPGKSFVDGDGYLVFVEQEGSVKYIHPEDNDAKYAVSTISADTVGEYSSTVKGVANDKWHHAKIRAAEGVLTISYDDGTEYSVGLNDYAGYIYLCSFTQTMQFKNVSITEVSDSPEGFVEQFTAYYLPNGTDCRNGIALTPADVSDLWMVSGETLTRAGKGTFAAGPSGVSGASLLYFEDTYTDFELTYDFSFNGTTATWKWAGAGFGASAKGKYFSEDDGYLSFIEQEGYRSMFDGRTSSRLAGELADYKALLSAGDSTWHTYKLILKGNTVEIYLDNYEIVTTKLDNYKGGYVYLFGATPGMQIKNITIQEITYVESTDTIDNITVNVGTNVSALNLPTRMNVTLNDNTSLTLPVIWETSNYDANVAGKYILEGTLDITGTNIYKNDSARKVKVVVRVADYDTNAVKTFDFISDTQINNTFVSYYVGKDNKLSATSEIKGADASRTWTATSNAGIKRTGAGDYAASTSQNLAGSLLYFKDKYTEFDLEFDYTFNGISGGWKWISVGVGAKAFGETGYTANGGTLAVVEMEGQIRTFTNDKTALITDKEAFNGYKETVSTATHHLRVSVKNSRMYIFVDNYPAADTALSNYTGGYVYLYGFTENLEIYNLRINSIATAELVEEVPYRSVQIGTPISEINLPLTLKVNLNGKIINCPVEWSSPNYNSGKEGTYSFFATPTGKYSHLWFSNDAKRLQASVTVGNTDEDVVQKFALTSTEELEAYFENYYVVSEHELFEKKYWTPTYAGNTWNVSSEGILKRTGQSSYGGGAKGTYGVSALYYRDRLENFEIEFDYRHGTGGWKWVTVMFGVDKIGSTYGENGYLAFVEQEGKVRVQGSTQGENMNFKDPFPASRYMDGYNEQRQAIHKGESNEWFNYRLVVTNGVARVYINGELWNCSLADDYKGGYVALSLNAANTTIRNLSITNYDAKEITIASIQSTKELGCDYIEIDKKKGDMLSLPEEMLVTDTNGYTYRMQIEWVNDTYRSGKLGTYIFTGNPILPSKMFRNPNNVAASSTVKITRVDYNPSTTVKYYFDSANDLLDFTEYYSANTAETNLAVSNWKDHWTITDGQLQRINDNFSNPQNDKFGTYRKMSRLTYNKELTGNYQIDVDYQQDTGTYMWAMICFATSDKTQFVVDYDSREEKFKPNAQGGTAVYLEKEGSVNFWGNMDNTNLDGTRLRLLETVEKLDGYDYKEMHHMTVTVIDGVARVYIDDYATNVAIRVPDEALGGYVSLMSNSNAVTFDNFAITQLSDDFKDGNVIEASATSNIAFTHSGETKETNDVFGGNKAFTIIIPILAIAIAGGAVIALCAASKKKKREEA